MMALGYPPSPYQLWARAHFPQAVFDLGRSGIPAPPREIVGMPKTLDDPRARSTLHRAIAVYNDVEMEEVTPALGTSHALWLAYASLLRPGDDVLVETPAYEPLVLKAMALGASVRRFARRPEDGYAIDVARVAGVIHDTTRAVVVSNLHNPSGVRAPEADLRALASACARHGGHLIVDEVFAPFDALVDRMGVFRGSARKLGANVIAVGSLTKCYGLDQERVGWLLGPPEVMQRAAQAVTLTMNAAPLSHAALASQAFARIDALAARARAIVRGKRELVEAFIESRPDLRWSAPTEGLFALIEVPHAADVREAIERGVASRGLVAAPGSFFGAPNAFRVSWALPEPKLLEALALLDELFPPPSPPPRRKR